jgi:hypothetical protein
VNDHLDYAFVLDPTDSLALDDFPFEASLPVGIFLSPKATAKETSVFCFIETVYRSLAMHITGGMNKLAIMFATGLAEAVKKTARPTDGAAAAAAPAGEAGAVGAMTPQRTVETDKGAQLAQGVVNASFNLRLQVFFSLLRDGINYIWSEESATSDEDSYHVLPFPLAVMALGEDFSMGASEHMSSVLGLPEIPVSAWSFTLTCAAMEKILQANGFTKNSVTPAKGGSRPRRARPMQQWRNFAEEEASSDRRRSTDLAASTACGSLGRSWRRT